MTWLLWVIVGVVFYSFGIGVARGLYRRFKARSCDYCARSLRGGSDLCWGGRYGDNHHGDDMAIGIFWPAALVGWLLWMILAALLKGPAAIMRAGQRLGQGCLPTDST